jgi:hypothetical protein
MDMSPLRLQEILLAVDDAHRKPNFAVFHTHCPNELRLAIIAQKIDLRVPIAEHVDMRGLMVIDKDHNAQPMLAKNGDHCLKNNLSRWIIQYSSRQVGHQRVQHDHAGRRGPKAGIADRFDQTLVLQASQSLVVKAPPGQSFVAREIDAFDKP